MAQSTGGSAQTNTWGAWPQTAPRTSVLIQKGGQDTLVSTEQNQVHDIKNWCPGQLAQVSQIQSEFELNFQLVYMDENLKVLPRSDETT